ncbi:MAG TPA: aminotransferase class V-fold PLP-dependent enzyme [Solirubrobacteraceae bacterium]|nr:aminotransferase class V-fold PLP-dependent enzyme [Solirubrobacteraceae bacterium]
MDPARLRAEFPVLERLTYLNAGTCGPLPAAARRAADEVADMAELDGRRDAYYDRFVALRDRQRDAYAALLGASPDDVAVTTSTSDGIARVVAGLELSSRDEVLVAEREHPSLLGPLLGAAMRSGVRIRTAPRAELVEAVGADTALVACSHVGWVTGTVAPDLSELAREVPVLLDGAQGIGAVPVDVRALGCSFYAASGQKWLCGPVGTGALYVAPEHRERLAPTTLAYFAYADATRALDPSAVHPTATRFDTPALAPETVAAALAALDVLGAYGWDRVHARARELAGRLAAALEASGRRVAPRAQTTLVAWEEADPHAATERLDAAGVAVRSVPGSPYLRASVGAWNDEDDLDRLLAAL